MKWAMKLWIRCYIYLVLLQSSSFIVSLIFEVCSLGKYKCVLANTVVMLSSLQLEALCGGLVVLCQAESAGFPCSLAIWVVSICSIFVKCASWKNMAKSWVEIIQLSSVMWKGRKEKFLMTVSVLHRNKIQECCVLTEGEMGDSSTEMEMSLKISLWLLAFQSR